MVGGGGVWADSHVPPLNLSLIDGNQLQYMHVLPTCHWLGGHILRSHYKYHQFMPSQCYQQVNTCTKWNSNLFCSVLEREKKRKLKNKQQNQILVHGLSRNNNGLSSVIVFPENHRARNARHQFQQTKNWRAEEVLKLDKVPIRAIIF